MPVSRTPPFTCPRCGSVSHSRHDAYEGYCGRCHDWTRDAPRYAPGGLVSPAEQLLTPRVLLDDPAWAYKGTQDDGRTAVWQLDVRREPWVSSWRPDVSLGAFTADWTENQLTLRVSAEAMARAAGELELEGMPAACTEVAGERDPGPRSAWSGEITGERGNSVPPSWVTDAIEVWDGCKDAAQRERSLAELAQDVADATPQIAPDERNPDHGTWARWSPDDPGDVIL